MPSAVRPAIAILIVSTMFRPLQAEDDPQARKIVSRAIKAIGGEAALKKVSRMTAADKGTYYGMGDGLPYQGRYAYDWPGRTRFEIVGVFSIIANDGKVWMQSQAGVQEVTGDPLKYQLEELEAGFISTLIPLAKPDRKFKLTHAGTEEIDAQTCDIVKIERGDRDPVLLSFSQKTGLLQKFTSTVHPAETGYKKATDVAFVSGYKEIDGVMTATKTKVLRDGKVFVESNLHQISYPEKFKAGRFDKPEAAAE